MEVKLSEYLTVAADGGQWPGAWLDWFAPPPPNGKEHSWYNLQSTLDGTQSRSPHYFCGLVVRVPGSRAGGLWFDFRCYQIF
jgi:hypothetical protein